MSEEKLIKKQLIKNMLYNLIAFTIIFTVFGIIIYNQVKTSIYSDAIKEMLLHKDSVNKVRIINTPNIVGGVLMEKDAGILMERGVGIIMDERIPDIKPNLSTINFQYGRMIPSPRITMVIRNENGEVENASGIGNFYEDYLSDLEFDSNNIDNIYDLKINNTYHYKGITMESIDDNNQKAYTQFLINVDSEFNIMNNLLRILVLGTMGTIALALIASYILSKKALAPTIEAWKKQTEFVQNASHELRTPLTIIQAKQEMLLKEPNSTIVEKSDEINLSIDEVRRLSKLTTELMTLARADSNEQQISRGKINIDELIKEVSKPYIEVAEMQEKEIKLNLSFEKEILIDANRIHQLMVILLDNSIKYTEKGDSIEITTYLKENKCVIEVSDTGIGISEEGLKRVFDRFYREDKARSRESGGTGLGLSIAHWIVSAHSGTIKATKNEPKGTVITVKLR